ncbi:hypothetical protein QE377_001005 [Microbacterium sp. SORGH_AS 862]|nr:hypothetical protein [Microbacterium sp. SORGH_AS_0862]
MNQPSKPMDDSKVVGAEQTDVRDELSLRKVARAVLAIARRQLHQEADQIARSTEEVSDERG